MRWFKIPFYWKMLKYLFVSMSLIPLMLLLLVFIFIIFLYMFKSETIQIIAWIFVCLVLLSFVVVFSVVLVSFAILVGSFVIFILRLS